MCNELSLCFKLVKGSVFKNSLEIKWQLFSRAGKLEKSVFHLSSVITLDKSLESNFDKFHTFLFYFIFLRIWQISYICVNHAC